jgi:hypothetical protein
MSLLFAIVVVACSCLLLVVLFMPLAKETKNTTRKRTIKQPKAKHGCSNNQTITKEKEDNGWPDKKQ